MTTQAKTSVAELVPPITVPQWAALEGPPFYELVRGRLVERPDVTIWHDIFLLDFVKFLAMYVSLHDLGKLVMSTAPLKISDVQGRKPDIFFILKDQYHLITRNFFKGIPPLIIEILSRSTEKIDRQDKYAEYAHLGVSQYWIIDCPNQRIEIHALGTRGEYALSDVVQGEVDFQPSMFPGLTIPLKEIWPTEFVDRDNE